jgi:hypothetical protein
LLISRYETLDQAFQLLWPFYPLKKSSRALGTPIYDRSDSIGAFSTVRARIDASWVAAALSLLAGAHSELRERLAVADQGFQFIVQLGITVDIGQLESQVDWLDLFRGMIQP